MTDPFDALGDLLRQRQQERGLTEFFRVGELVRFPLGVHWNRERDYRIKTIYNNGFEVECDGHVYPHTDADVLRLGMTHSPTLQVRQRP
ncbi:hypothetical protein [Streptomyces canus]|uniref:hypothetical protein n=1 Tax=Streptomyces canus TaxID=58343 RepID=UPI0027830AF2|nr:hypothetical protein [Streptomyces canus]MDQ0758683.1 hypothetical protein [Streptomyces canus]